MGYEDLRGLPARVLVLLRAYQGMSQRALARRSGIQELKISQFERGSRVPDQEEERALLQGLDLPQRAWEAFEDVVEWVDWLVERRGLSGDEGLARGDEDVEREDELLDARGRRAAVHRLVDGVGLSVQLELVEVLHAALETRPRAKRRRRPR